MALFGPPNIEKLEQKKKVKGLIKALGYKKDGWTRRGAAEALGRLGDRLAVEPLIQALRDEGVHQDGAAEALGKLGDARALRPLVDALYIRA